MSSFVYGLKKFRQYLIGMKFTLVTDHIAIKWLLSKIELPGRLARWALILSEFSQLEIIHRPGAKMADVDYLSRHPVDKAPVEEIEDDTDVLIAFIRGRKKRARKYKAFSSADVTQSITHQEYIEE